MVNLQPLPSEEAGPALALLCPVRALRIYVDHTQSFGSSEQLFVKSSHYYLYSAFNNANCVKAALHQLEIKLGGFTSALQYLDWEIVCRNSVILLWPDKISSLNLGCSSQIVQRTHLVPVVLSRWPSRRQGLHWGSVSGAHLVVLVSADVQGCRGHL